MLWTRFHVELTPDACKACRMPNTGSRYIEALEKTSLDMFLACSRTHERLRVTEAEA